MARGFTPAVDHLESSPWEFLPFQFERFSDGRVLLTNLVGEHLLVSEDDFALFIEKQLDATSDLSRRLRSRHFIRRGQEDLPLELLALKTRTRFRRLDSFVSLHIFVVSLRCEHSCPYCQVSRRSGDRARYDMTESTAERALELVFMSPSEQIKIEFQGGEPLMNWELITKIVLDAEALNLHYGKDISFVIASNLALLTDEVLSFCGDHDVFISTSLDGPADLHNANRPRLGGNSWELAVSGINRVRETLGVDRVSALMTTTEPSLGRVRDIVDCYVEQGFSSIFLRPMSPYGFAMKTKQHSRYDVERWLAFYEEGLDYILELNRSGTTLFEQFAALVLKKILTNDDPGYVDLTSPAGAGRAVAVYNYDGDVYSSDEGRMLAEMGDHTFRLGNVHHDTFPELFLADELTVPLDETFTWSVPMCSDCAFEPYCGADPTLHHTLYRDVVGRKPVSVFHKRNRAIFEMLISRYEGDQHAREVLSRWVFS